MRPADFCLIGRSRAVFPVMIPSFGKGLWASLICRGATREAESGKSPGNGVGCCFSTHNYSFKVKVVVLLQTTLGTEAEHLGTKLNEDSALGCS